MNGVGVLYFIVIVLANTIGAISGMGGGVIIKPVLDFVGSHSVASVSFYSTVAVFTMSIISTWRQLKSGVRFNLNIIGWVSAGAVLGGILGNIAFDYLLNSLESAATVQMIQIILTVITLIFAFLYTRTDNLHFELNNVIWYLLCGLVLGLLASLLGIGGGPINVSLLMLMFGLPIKDATVYSICTIFFSQLSKLITISVTTGFMRYDLSILYYVILAAIVGGLLGAKVSHILSPQKVTLVFQAVIVLVLLINIYNGWQLL